MQMDNLVYARIMDSIMLFGRHIIPAFSQGTRAEEEPNVFDAIYRARLCPLYG
jgi:hypothetical protein